MGMGHSCTNCIYSNSINYVYFGKKKYQLSFVHESFLIQVHSRYSSHESSVQSFARTLCQSIHSTVSCRDSIDKTHLLVRAIAIDSVHMSQRCVIYIYIYIYMNHLSSMYQLLCGHHYHPWSLVNILRNYHQTNEKPQSKKTK